jgi:dienelactone hydrolase
MQYLIEVKGEPDESGYPLYITLHGGGSATKEENDSAWHEMFGYYKDSVDHGIYVACRGMEDVWNMHFIPDAYAMYDRIIEDMVLLKNADPNRVYLLGFSAGGDGVYQITPRLADRLAAANMSSGHPNSVSLLNVANVPFQIQVGMRDFYSDTALRCIRGAEFEKTLGDYHDTYGFGYERRVLVHVPEGHGINDCSAASDPNSLVLLDPAAYALRARNENWLKVFSDIYITYYPFYYLDERHPDLVTGLSYRSAEGSIEDIVEEADRQAALETFSDFSASLMQKVTGSEEGEFDMQTAIEDTDAVHYVSDYTRSYCPARLVWDLSTRADKRDVSSFYWLKADKSVNKGQVVASFDVGTNAFTLNPSDDVSGDFSVLINPAFTARRSAGSAGPMTGQTPAPPICLRVPKLWSCRYSPSARYPSTTTQTSRLT